MCPSSTTCWALEAGKLLSSADGGDTWRVRNAIVPSDVAALHAIDCPSEVRCYLSATGTDGSTRVLALRNRAIAEYSVTSTATLVAISCPEVRVCVAIDGSALWVTKDGAWTWQSRPLPAVLSPTPDVTCVRGTTICTIVGDRGETPVVERTVNLGLDWKPETAPSPTDGLYSVVCPSASTCYAGGSTFSDFAEVIRTTNSGRTWTFASVPSQGYPVRSVACASETACWALGSSPGRTPFVFATSDGQQFTAQSLAPVETQHPGAVACPSATRCAAVAGGIAFVTENAGGQWSDIALPAGVEAPTALSCPSSTDCVAVGNDAVGRPQALTSPDGGTTWNAHRLPAGTGGLVAVDCPTAAVCIALATTTAAGSTRQQQIAQALHSSDGGVTWKLGFVADRRGVLGKLACPSTTTCVASGYDNRSNAKLEVTRDGGAHWSALAAPDGVFTIDAIGCSAVDACVVIAGNPNAAPQAFTTTDLGTTFDPHPVPYADSANVFFNDLDCSGRTCVAVGEYFGSGVIMRSRDVGATWQAAKVPASAQIVGKVSCGSPSNCAAATFDFRQGGGPVVVESTTAGRSWRAFGVPARQEQPIAISCHVSGCIASDVSDAGNPIVLAGAF